jgi:hypothetical protein
LTYEVDGSGPKRRHRYPMEKLEIGDKLIVHNPKPYLRGSLYNRADALEMRCTIRTLASGSVQVERLR